MEHEEFEKIVADGISSVPQKFLDRLHNVAIVIEDTPNAFHVKRFHLHYGFTLFGLYEGVPPTKGTGLLPAKITLFKDPIVSSARNIDDMKEIVKHTVWHEIAHAFGMDEEAVRTAEARRLQKISP